jgi:hypothetical protein
LSIFQNSFFAFILRHSLYRFWYNISLIIKSSTKKGEKIIMAQQELRDKSGKLLGKIETNGNKQTLRYAGGKLLGTFDGVQTRNAGGSLVGNGNLLATLLK